MNITIFGGAHPKPGDPAYQEAYDLGRLLAEAGHTILTGGYVGTMEAASRGAAEGGGHIIGVTCAEIEDWRKSRINPWVQEEWRCMTLFERLSKLIENCQAAIALPGGAGTLVEVSLTWNLLIIQAIPPRPLVLVGPGWQSVFDQFFSSLGPFTSLPDRRLLHFAPDIHSVLHQINLSNAAIT